MRYKIKVKNPNKMFIVNNKPVRSPFQCFTNEDGLCLIKSRIKFYGLLERDYEIEEVTSTSEKEKKDYSYIEQKRESVKTINENCNPISKLQQIQLVKNNNILIKEKNENHGERNQLITKVNLTPSNLEPELEQTINNQYSSDIEVKIEELSVKSSSILEKFLESEF